MQGILSDVIYVIAKKTLRDRKDKGNSINSLKKGELYMVNYTEFHFLHK